MKLTIWDFAFLFLYCLSLPAIGCYHARKNKDACEFLLAGRKLTLPVFVGTLVATFYGGILGIAEFTSVHGLGAWLTQGIFWYIVYLLFALFLACKIRKMEFYTIPDILEHRYGKKVALVGGIFTYLMVNPAPYIVSLAIILQTFTNISFFLAILAVTMFAMIYTIWGGFRGIVYTDFFQCILMYTGFLVLACFTLYEYGFPEFLQKNLSLVKGFECHLNITGNMSWDYILVWAGISSWVFVDPNFYQRCYAAKTPKIAQRGIFFAILFWFCFDILSCGTALYAFASQNAQNFSIPQPGMAHLVLADHVLPSPFKGLFLASVIALILSTLDSYLFTAAMNISRDYYWRFLNREASSSQMVRITRIAIVVTSFLSAFLAFALPSVVDLWYTLGTIGLSALLVPMMYSFVGKYRLVQTSFISMISGATIASIWLITGIFHAKEGIFQYPWDCQPFYPGIATSLLCFAIGYTKEKNRIAMNL